MGSAVSVLVPVVPESDTDAPPKYGSIFAIGQATSGRLASGCQNRTRHRTSQAGEALPASTATEDNVLQAALDPYSDPYRDLERESNKEHTQEVVKSEMQDCAIRISSNDDGSLNAAVGTGSIKEDAHIGQSEKKPSFRDTIRYSKGLFIQRQTHDYYISMDDFQDILLQVLQFNGIQAHVRIELVDSIMAGALEHFDRVNWKHMKRAIESVFEEMEAFPALTLPGTDEG